MLVLEKTIKEMPNSFTSNEFNKRAVKNGYPRRSLQRKGLASFIKKYADNAYEGSKTWVKKDAQSNLMTHAQSNLMTDKEMIEHLKIKGYKIMKPVSDWVEC